MLQMRHDDYGHQLWKAEEMAAFVADRTGLKVDKIERPSFFRSALFPPTALAVLGGCAYMAWLLYQVPNSYFLVCAINKRVKCTS